jgi:single-strand DNA-binding protein
MQSENRAILVGNLGGDAELRDVNGTFMAVMNVATSEAWTSKDGQKQEKTEWHRVVVWGKTAEALAAFLTKGRAVYVTGKIAYREYEKDGQKRFTTEIRAERVILLGHKAHTEAQGQAAASAPRKRQHTAVTVSDDDIPF